MHLSYFQRGMKNVVKNSLSVVFVGAKRARAYRRWWCVCGREGGNREISDFEEWGLDLEIRKAPGLLPHACNVTLLLLC